GVPADARGVPGVAGSVILPAVASDVPQPLSATSATARVINHHQRRIVAPRLAVNDIGADHLDRASGFTLSNGSGGWSVSSGGTAVLTP
ncbi:MAG: hypothetical protein ACTHNK_15720, partial [Thermomicrobiales bacterium]